MYHKFVFSENIQIDNIDKVDIVKGNPNWQAKMT